jgi:hypothetical protein
MPKNGTVIDKDMGLEAFIKQLASLPQEASVQVGIQDGSPKRQFRYGTLQKFRLETADLLLRTTVDERTEEIQKDLMEVALKGLTADANLAGELQNLGAKLQQTMREQTDPPPQLATSIIVKVDA